MESPPPLPAPGLRKLPRRREAPVDEAQAKAQGQHRVCYFPRDPLRWRDSLAPGTPLPELSALPTSTAVGTPSVAVPALSVTAERRTGAPPPPAVPSPALHTPPSPPLTHEAETPEGEPADAVPAPAPKPATVGPSVSTAPPSRPASAPIPVAPNEIKRPLPTNLFEDDTRAPAPKKPRLSPPPAHSPARAFSPDSAMEAQRALLARITAKMDLDKGFESDTHSETSTSPRKQTAEQIRAAESGVPRRDNRYLSAKSMSPGTDALEVIRPELDKYLIFGDETPSPLSPDLTDDNPLVVDFEFPGEGAVEKYPLIHPRKSGELDPVGDIYSTAKLLVQHVVPAAHRGRLGDINAGILRSVLKAIHTRNRPALREAIEEWNARMKEMKAEGVFALLELQGPRAPIPLVNHILEQAYSRTVAPYSELLNQYRAFGNNVYGEVKSSLVREFIKNARIEPGSVFIDMGSGIGNVVLQVAGEVCAEAHGIEVMDIPAKLASRQLKEFLVRMRYYAQPCGKLKLRHGNFLEDKETDEVLKRADVVFVNNFAFDPNLNQRILAKFLDLREGARVISLKSFVAQDRRINYRTADA